MNVRRTSRYSVSGSFHTRIKHRRVQGPVRVAAVAHDHGSHGHSGSHGNPRGARLGRIGVTGIVVGVGTSAGAA